MICWVIYNSPKDFPGRFVARKWLGIAPTDEVLTSPYVELLRSVLEARGLARVERMDGDDPVILETWL